MKVIAAILLVLVLAGAAAGIGVSAYNAGVTAGLVQSGQIVAAPGTYAVAPYVGWGAGPGFGFFGFFGLLLFLFVLIGLARAAFGGSRRGWGPGGPGGWGGPNGSRSDAWERRVRETHDALHRDSGNGPDEAART
jgi:hypothetical protein